MFTIARDLTKVLMYLQWLPEDVDVEARGEAIYSRRDVNFMFSLFYFFISDVHCHAWGNKWVFLLYGSFLSLCQKIVLNILSG